MDVIEELRECKTPAQFYRIRIIIENLLTPAQFLDVAANVDQFPEPTRGWFKTFETQMLSGNTQIQNYQREPLGAHIDFFEGSGDRDHAKTLLLSFCGRDPFRPLALPTAIFLQYVPASRFDVLVLRDPSDLWFLKGVPGYADSIEVLVQRIERDLPISTYHSVRSSGICAGGYAALVAGELLDAECAVSFGGAHPRCSSHQDSFRNAELDGYEADRVLGNIERISAVKMSNIYAQDCSWDKERAKSLYTMFPSLRNVEVAGVKSHLLASELLNRNALKQLLDQTLIGASDSIAWVPRNQK